MFSEVEERVKGEEEKNYFTLLSISVILLGIRKSCIFV